LDVDCGDCHHNPDATFNYTIRLDKDGDQWCALLGVNLQEGMAGFGDTKAEAIIELGKALQKQPSQSDAPSTEPTGKGGEDGEVSEMFDEKAMDEWWKSLKSKEKQSIMEGFGYTEEYSGTVG
jgi:hypothetical protein